MEGGILDFKFDKRVRRKIADANFIYLSHPYFKNALRIQRRESGRDKGDEIFIEWLVRLITHETLHRVFRLREMVVDIYSHGLTLEAEEWIIRKLVEEM